MLQTNNAGKSVAILGAAQNAPLNQALLIQRYSQIMIDNLTKHLVDKEDNG